MVGKFRFFVGGVIMPFITKKPVRSLGKVFDGSLRQTASVQTTKKLEA